MIIDCHCHAGTGDGLTGPWDTSAPLDAYLRRADAAGIRHTVLFAPFHTDYAVANREVARIVARGAGRFTGFAFVHAERDRGRVAALVGEAVTRFGFRGIKLHRHDARITREVCDVARRFRLPVLYDPTGEVSTVELVAAEYPDVTFIIPHLGSFADDWRAQTAFVDQLVRWPNVLTDTSGVRRFDLLVEAVRRGGAHKVLFGSDGPWLHPAWSWRRCGCSASRRPRSGSCWAATRRGCSRRRGGATVRRRARRPSRPVTRGARRPPYACGARR
jgi:predicted TIM-barrel fold metal-dependent hydrolase